MRISQARNGQDLLSYQELTEQWLGIRYPIEYLEKASIFLAKDPIGTIVGGFCIQSKPPFRVLDSIPQDVTVQTVSKPVELTGLWFRPDSKKPTGRVRFWLALCAQFFRHANKNVVFAYSSTKVGLAKAYAFSKPQVLFSGLTQIQPGMSEPESEVVCVTRGYRIALLPLLRPHFYLKRLFPRGSRVS